MALWEGRAAPEGTSGSSNLNPLSQRREETMWLTWGNDSLPRPRVWVWGHGLRELTGAPGADRRLRQNLVFWQSWRLEYVCDHERMMEDGLWVGLRQLVYLMFSASHDSRHKYICWHWDCQPLFSFWKDMKRVWHKFNNILLEGVEKRTLLRVRLYVPQLKVIAHFWSYIGTGISTNSNTTCLQ